MDNVIDTVNLFCGTLLVFGFVAGALALIINYVRHGSQTYDRNQTDEIYNAASHDPKVNEAVINEVAAVVEQRRSGRERGGLLRLFIRNEPVTFDAQLNLKTIRKSGMVDTHTIDKD